MTNKEIVLRFFDEVFNAHDLTKVGEYVRKDYIQHNPQAAQGLDGLLEFLKGFFQLEARHDVQFALEDGDKLAVYVYVTFKDGSKAIVTDIFRLEDGMMVEHWDSVQRNASF